MAFIEKKNILYVGGVDDSVNEEILHAAFIPFGDLKSIQIPRDFSSSKFLRTLRPTPNFKTQIITDKPRGYAFVEFETEEDAADAIDNMDGSELFGKVLRCNVAKAVSKLAPGKAVWSSEEWIQNSLNDLDVVDDDKVAELTLIPERGGAHMDDDEETEANQ